MSLSLLSWLLYAKTYDLSSKSGAEAMFSEYQLHTSPYFVRAKGVLEHPEHHARYATSSKCFCSVTAVLTPSGRLPLLALLWK